MPRYLPALLSLLSSIAYAQDDSILRIFCRPAEPWLYMTTMDTPQAKSLAGHALEPVDAGALVSYTPEDEKGDIYRSGSLSTDRKCGSLSIRISGGYYNANTQGQLGAKEDYPIVEITDGPKRFGPFAIGSCSASSERSSMMVACPQNWATAITVFQSQGKPVAHLVHEYEDYLAP